MIWPFAKKKHIKKSDTVVTVTTPKYTTITTDELEILQLAHKAQLARLRLYKKLDDRSDTGGTGDLVMAIRNTEKAWMDKYEALLKKLG